MNCPTCSQPTIVLKTLGLERRRKCTTCEHRFTTVEVLKEEAQRQDEAVQTVLEAAKKLRRAA